MNIELKKATREEYDYPTKFYGEDEIGREFIATYQNQTLNVKFSDQVLFNAFLGEIDFLSIEHVLALLAGVNVFVTIEEYYDEFGLMENVSYKEVMWIVPLTTSQRREKGRNDRIRTLGRLHDCLYLWL